MSAHDSQPGALTHEQLTHIAEAYASLLSLADRDPRNIPLCQSILLAVSEFDLYVGERHGRPALSPYVELNEYFQYLLDLQQPAESEERRAYELETLGRFKAMVIEFVNRYAPDFDAS